MTSTTEKRTTKRNVPSVQRSKRGHAGGIRRALLILATLLLACSCIAGIMASPWLYVRSVKVDGLTGLSKEEKAATLNACRIREKTSIALMPSAELEKRIERLSWISAATVTRRPPSGVVVEVVPKTPFAVALAGGRHWELDRAGTVIRRAGGRGTLPYLELVSQQVRVSAGSISVAVSREALEVVEKSRRIKAPEIDKIIVDRNSYMCLNMSDGILIRLGQGDRLQTKLNLIEAIYRERPEITDEVEAIDLTAPEHPACTPRSRRSSTARSRIDRDSNSQPAQSGAL